MCVHHSSDTKVYFYAIYYQRSRSFCFCKPGVQGYSSFYSFFILCAIFLSFSNTLNGVRQEPVRTTAILYAVTLKWSRRNRAFSYPFLSATVTASFVLSLPTTILRLVACQSLYHHKSITTVKIPSVT